MQRFNLLLKVGNASCYLQGDIVRPFFIPGYFLFLQDLPGKRELVSYRPRHLKKTIPKKSKNKKDILKNLKQSRKNFSSSGHDLRQVAVLRYFHMLPNKKVGSWERTRKGFDLNYLTNTYKYLQILLEFTCQFATLGILTITLGV